MRISDWSSDVCSSDLIEAGGDHRRRHRLPQRAQRPRHLVAIDRPDAVPVDRGGGGHAACSWRSWTRSTKMSSSELFEVSRSLKPIRSEEHTSELQSLMRISYAVFCLKTKKTTTVVRDGSRIRTQFTNSKLTMLHKS